MSEPSITPRDETHAPDSAYAADRILGPVRRLTRLLSLLLIGVMILLPFVQVILREIVGVPFVGAEELTRFMLICVVFITFPYVVVSGSNIRLEEFQLLLPPTPRRMLHILISATGAIVLGIAAAAIAVATINNLNNATPTLGIPYWVFFSMAFAGFLLAAIECVVQLWKAVRHLPLYVTFKDEAPAEDMSSLEEALVAQLAASAEGPRT